MYAQKIWPNLEVLRAQTLCPCLAKNRSFSNYKVSNIGQNVAFIVFLINFGIISIMASTNWFQSLHIDLSLYKLVSVSTKWFQSLKIGFSLYKLFSVSTNLFQYLQIDFSIYKLISDSKNWFQVLKIDFSLYKHIITFCYKELMDSLTKWLPLYRLWFANYFLLQRVNRFINKEIIVISVIYCLVFSTLHVSFKKHIKDINVI